MKINNPILCLEGDLKEIERQIGILSPPICTNDKYYQALLKLRSKFKAAIKCLKSNEKIKCTKDLSIELISKTYKISNDNDERIRVDYDPRLCTFYTTRIRVRAQSNIIERSINLIKKCHE